MLCDFIGFIFVYKLVRLVHKNMMEKNHGVYRRI